MWRRRGSIGGLSTSSKEAKEQGGKSDSGSRHSDPTSTSGQSNSITGYPSISRGTFFGGGGNSSSDIKTSDRANVFRIDVPSPGPLGLDLRARHVERDRPQRGAVVKGFRPLAGGRRGFVEETGRVKVGDILQLIHTTDIDDMPFDQIVQHALQLQRDPSAWPLRLEFRREVLDAVEDKPRRSSFFRSSMIMNPAQDRNFNEKLQYFRGFFANKIPTGGAAPKAKEKPPQMPATETVNEMYRDLLSKRGVPDDVMDELVRIEPLENKWNIVWYAQQHENDEMTPSNLNEAAKLAENLVQLNWDNKGLKDLEALHQKIASGSSEWAETFLSNFGLDYLANKLPEASPFAIEHHKYEKATQICGVILRILRSLTHFTAGVEAITNTPGLVKRTALCFHTEDSKVKKQTLQLLGIVCYNSAAGHQAVVEAFTHYKEVKGEAVRFGCLRDALRSTRYPLDFKEDVLSFVNIIVNKAIRLEDRLAIRSDFLALNMAGYFEEVRAKSQAMQRQSMATMSPGFTPLSPPQDATPQRLEVKAKPVETDSLRSQLEDRLRSGSILRGSSPDRSRSATRLTRSPSMSKSAPPSPRDRTASDSDRSSLLSSRQSITDDGSGSTTSMGSLLGDDRKRIISSGVSQLRNQLDNMEKQIEVFERFMEDDRKDTIYDHTDLASLESVFQSLMDSVAGDVELQACLLSILQQLLFFPGDLVIGKEMWALCERLMKEVALLSPVEEVRNYTMSYEERKAVLRLRDKYTAFLQRCAEEDPSFTFHMGPILLIENRKPHSDDLLLGDDTSDETDDEDSSVSGLVRADEHPDLAKFFKLLRMGMPLEQVQLKMQRETSMDVAILESPAKMISLSGDEPTGPQGIRAEEHELFAKFFKLKKMGMPLPHIQLKMQAEGLDANILETPDALLDEEGKPWQEGKTADAPAGTPAREHELYAKYFKLLKMGMPMPHVQLKVSADGLDATLLETPDALLDAEGKRVPETTAVAGIPVREHPSYAKFFKLMKMGMPLEQIKLKASAEGLNASLLDSPEVLLNDDGSLLQTGPTGVPAREHEKYAKFFKLMKMGMPQEQVKLKMAAEGLCADLLDTPDRLVDADGHVVEDTTVLKGTPACEHEKYAKFFKLKKMGMPLEQIKLKMSAEGLKADLLDAPDTLLDEEGNEVKADTPKGVAVRDHEKFAKFFKLMKMGMPLEQVKLKASSEGLNAALLETPDALVDSDGNPLAKEKEMVVVREHPSYAKFFKLAKMGMPRPQLELRMKAEGLDVSLLETPDAKIPLESEDTDKAPSGPVVPPPPPPPPKPKLRNLYWDAVDEKAVNGTIWGEFDSTTDSDDSPSPSSDEASPEAPKAKDNVLEQYMEKLAEMFVVKPAKTKESSAGSDAKKASGKRRAPMRVALIDVKRANNIGIMLARFRLPYAKIRDAVLEVDKELLSIEKVSALLQFAPEDAELEAVKAYSGDPKLLGDAEQYFREMLCVPRLPTRLQAIHATWQFDTYVEEQQRLMDSVRNACRELKECKRLREIFRVVLSLGNALNDGTARGGAKGFRLSILLKLNQVKASDNSMTLLNYVAQLLRKKDPSILSFDEELPSIESASRVTMQVLKAGESAVRKAATLICDELEAHSKLPVPTPVASQEDDAPVPQDRFQDAIRPFAERAQQTSEHIQRELEEMIASFEQTLAYYGEDPASPESGPDSFFSIFFSFAKLLQTADRDNERKRIAEERRIRREEETKKRLEMLKNRKKKTSFASLKDGDVDDIMMKIRAKRVAEKRQELLETPFEATDDRGRSSSRCSATASAPNSARPHVDSTGPKVPAPPHTVGGVSSAELTTAILRAEIDALCTRVTLVGEPSTAAPLFFYSRVEEANANAASTTETPAALADAESADSLVQEAPTQDAPEPADPSDLLDATRRVATDASSFFSRVSGWKRIPRAVARIVIADNEKLVSKESVRRWIAAELRRVQDTEGGDVDEELVEYTLGLLEHPEFAHPDLVVLELQEFLGRETATSFVLALWKFMIMEIGLRHVHKVGRRPMSSEISTMSHRFSGSAAAPSNNNNNNSFVPERSSTRCAKPPGGASTMGSLLFGGDCDSNNAASSSYLDERKTRRFKSQEMPEQTNPIVDKNSFYGSETAAQRERDRVTLPPGAVPRDALVVAAPGGYGRRGSNPGPSSSMSEYFSNGMGDADNQIRRSTRRMFGPSGGASTFKLG
ncbi:hypothetical protein P43SY_007833 [Pythium insidiosum]|uniref:Formin-homology 2 domain-containing protein n=1 Tax=Pythium insidiosum TaxID=114742 RepID=A0AAD5LA91_PYTIN|nr:hypothetical protein P43SY_007833 [Pythium insidiosum]